MILGRHDLLRYGVYVMPTNLPLNEEYSKLLDSRLGKLFVNKPYKKNLKDPNDYVIVLYHDRDRFEWCDIDINDYVEVKKCNVKVLLYRETENMIYAYML